MSITRDGNNKNRARLHTQTHIRNKKSNSDTYIVSRTQSLSATRAEDLRQTARLANYPDTCTYMCARVCKRMDI